MVMGTPLAATPSVSVNRPERTTTVNRFQVPQERYSPRGELCKPEPVIHLSTLGSGDSVSEIPDAPVPLPDDAHVGAAAAIWDAERSAPALPGLLTAAGPSDEDATWLARRILTGSGRIPAN